MYYEKLNISVEGSLPDSSLSLFIHESSDTIGIKKRPIVLICPGGGYQYTSDREADPIAYQFLAMGYHAAVLRYSCAPAVYPTALFELCKSMIYLRDNADKYSIDENKIFVSGFSAGGHLAASLGVFWNTDKQLSNTFNVSAEKIKPNALILSYPVITSGEFAHKGSFESLLNSDKSLYDKMSLEKQVNEFVPATFMWHTFEDTAVPLENTLLFAKALREHKIPFEYHVFPVGHHGLALANEITDCGEGNEIVPQCQPWISLCKTFLSFI